MGFVLIQTTMEETKHKNRDYIVAKLFISFVDFAYDRFPFQPHHSTIPRRFLNDAQTQKKIEV